MARRGVVSLTLVVLAAASVARAAEVGGLLDRWLAAQTNLHTWTAEVIQTRSLKVLSQPLVSTGKVSVAVPDRFRWELGQPAQTVVLRLPEELLIIYPRLKRAEKYPLTGAQPGPWKDALALLEASFPKSRTELESRFRVVALPQTNSLAQLALQPKSASARKFISEIVIGFHTNDCSMASTEMRFADGSSLRNEFINGVINPPLDPAIFEAKLAPDVTVVEPLHP
jgi:outer membrane lipoprotein-sorting protein